MAATIETRVGAFVIIALGIFIYMSIQIGAFRFDRSKYAMHTMYFKDISGLARKAEVKIAGVKVGWVEAIKLLPDHQMYAQADVMINKDYALYSDAYAVVRQEGLLGPKFLEVVPGDPILRKLDEGEALHAPNKEPVSMDDLMRQFKTIAGNVEEITNSVKDTVGGTHGKKQLQETFDNITKASERIASFADVIDRVLGRNEENIDQFFNVGPDLHRIAEKIENQVVPAFNDNLDKITNAFEDTALQAREGLVNFTSVTQKIDEGKGLLGKLINEEDTYRDLKVAVSGIKNYFAKIDRMQIVFDGHSEMMNRPSDYYYHEDNKGYFDVRLYPAEDHFYMLQIVASEKGFIYRWDKEMRYASKNNLDKIETDGMCLSDKDRLKYIFTKRKTLINRDDFRIGIQYGKIFNDIALRIGLFDGTFGAGVDFDIPFGCEKFRWVTTFEVFDINGRNRLNDRRPHLKWLNRVFIFRNIYATFGADDFISKHNANAFFGVGVRFGDDDVKYLLSSVGSLSGIDLYNGSVVAKN